MASCLLVTSILCVLVTTVATIVSFATPNWLSYPLLSLSKSVCNCNFGNCDCGLWLYCTSHGTDNCRWFFSDDFALEKDLPIWYKAVQGLMSCAVASSMLALLIGLFSLCCYCRDCSPHHSAGAFINLTFLLLAAGICTFGAKAHLDLDAQVKTGMFNKPVFSWSFWVGVGAAGMSLISSIFLFLVGRNDQYVV